MSIYFIQSLTNNWNQQRCWIYQNMKNIKIIKKVLYSIITMTKKAYYTQKLSLSYQICFFILYNSIERFIQKKNSLETFVIFFNNRLNNLHISKKNWNINRKQNYTNNKNNQKNDSFLYFLNYLEDMKHNLWKKEKKKKISRLSYKFDSSRI